MYVSFKLVSNRNNAWNGVYTGQNNPRYLIMNFRHSPKEEKQRIKNIIEHKSTFYYDYEDGWEDRVEVEIVDAKEAKRREKISVGFAKDWMVRQILETGRIWTRSERINEKENKIRPTIESYALPVNK